MKLITYPRLNLLPASYAAWRRRQRLIHTLILFLLCLGVILSLVAVYLYTVHARLVDQQQSLLERRQQLVSLQNLKREVTMRLRVIEEKRNLVEQCEMKSLQVLKHIAQVETALPQGISLTYLAASQGHLSLTGISEDPELIPFFVTSLQGYFGQGVRLETWERVEANRFRFQVTGEMVTDETSRH
ncbi:MAG: PilN domain-containing protein [bacterium]|jgi:Tfp pilus assembly protein PilN